MKMVADNNGDVNGTDPSPHSWAEGPVSHHSAESVQVRPTQQTADEVILQQIEAVPRDLSPRALADFISSIMNTLIDGVDNEIARNCYLDRLRSVLRSNGYPNVPMAQLRREFDAAVRARGDPRSAQGISAEPEAVPLARV